MCVRKGKCCFWYSSAVFKFAQPEEHAHIHTQANMCVAERIEKDFYLCLFLLLGYLFKIFTLTLLL